MKETVKHYTWRCQISYKNWSDFEKKFMGTFIKG